MAEYKHQLVVHVTSDVDRGQRQMQDRFLRWIAAEGHTSVNMGFEVVAVGVITRKKSHQVGGRIDLDGSDKESE